MKNNSELDALFEAARAEVIDTTRAEFGFETRLMARIREDRKSSVSWWAWKLAPFFAALALAASYWSSTTPRRIAVDTEIIAEATHGSDEQLLAAYMTGAQP